MLCCALLWSGWTRLSSRNGHPPSAATTGSSRISLAPVLPLGGNQGQEAEDAHGGRRRVGFLRPTLRLLRGLPSAAEQTVALSGGMQPKTASPHRWVQEKFCRAGTAWGGLRSLHSTSQRRGPIQEDCGPGFLDVAVLRRGECLRPSRSALFKRARLSALVNLLALPDGGSQLGLPCPRGTHRRHHLAGSEGVAPGPSPTTPGDSGPPRHRRTGAAGC